MFARMFRFAKLLRLRKQSPIYNQKYRRRLKNQLPHLELLEDRTVPTGLVATDLTTGLTAQDLATKILGPGVTASNVQLTAAPGTAGPSDVKFGNSSSAGIFAGGTGIIGFESGIILSTGGVQNAIGPNVSISTSQTNGMPGDADLTALIGKNTFDATVLSFDFVPQKSTLSFQFVFSSEEYNLFSNSQFNDVFGAYLNDVTAGQTPVNVAVLPSTTLPVSVDNVNATQNSSFFINNDITSGAPINIEMNGLTTVLPVSRTVVPGHTYHIKLVIADAIDGMIDSNVFIKAHSFTTVAAPVVTTSQATVTYGTPVTFTATETTSGILPTDTVSFYDGLTLLGPGTLQSNNGSTAVWTYTTPSTQLQVGAAQPIEAFYTPTGSSSSVEGDLAGGETVQPHALTITAAANTKVYDSTTSAAATPTVTGLQGTDSVSGLSETYNNANAGTSKTLSVSSGYTVNDGNGGNNYNVTTVSNTTGVINKASLTITALTNTKVYNATTSAAAVPTVSGLVGGDTVTGLSESYNNANAGTGKTLTVNTVGVIGSYSPIAPLTGLTGPFSFAFDGSGDLFVSNGGTTVSEFFPGATTPSATLTGLNNPTSLVFDGSGNLFVANFGSNTVSKFAPGATTAGTTLSGGLSSPIALAFDGAGNLFVANGNGGTVSEFFPGATSPSTTLTGLSEPWALAFDASGNLFVANSSADTISKFLPGTTTPSATLTGVSHPLGLAIDAGGNLFVANAGNSTVSKFIPGATTPSATLTGLNSPQGLAFDASGNLLVANFGGLSGTTVSEFFPGALTPSVTYTGLVGPIRVAIGGNGILYVSNEQGNTVSRFTPAFSSGYTVNDGNGGNNYTVTTVANNTGVINKAALTITAATSTKTYDSTTTSAATPTVSGLQGTDTVTGLAEVFSSRDASAPGKTLLSVSAYTINDGNSGNNYTVTKINNLTGMINKAALTITALTNTKAYDGGTGAAAIPTVAGLQGADTVTGLVEVYSDKNAGTGKTLSVSAYTVNDGFRGYNYSVTTVNNTTGAINKATLTITALTNTKAYDSTTSAAATPTVSGLLDGDTVTGLVEVYSNKNAGSGKTLSVSAYTVNDGNSGNNYNVTTLTNNTGLINKASLTITALTNSKTYDGNTSALATPTVSGLIGGDTATGLKEVYSDRNAGSSKTLSVSAYTINDGNSGNNYTVTTVTNTTGLINKASLTITALTNTKVYDATTSAAATPTVTGLLDGDTVTGLVEVYTDRNVGTGKTLSVNAYTVNDGNSGNNYTVTTVANTTGVINKATLTITALTNTKAYDSTTTAAATPTVAGLVDGDTVTGLTEVYSDKNAGTGKTLSVSTYTVNDGNSGNNYVVTTITNTTGVINKAALTITALTNTKTYDGNASAAAVPTVSGLIGGDTATGLAEVYSNRNAGSGKTLSVSAYTINDGNSGNNYTVTTIANTTGLINKAALTITALTNTKTYDATTTAGAVPTVAGLLDGDTVTGLKEVYSDPNAGSGKTLSVSAYTVNDGNSGNNYTVTTLTNTTGLINKASLTITALTNTKTYDSTTSAAATPTVAGLQGGDSVTGLVEIYTNPNAGTGKTLSVSAYTVNDGNSGNNYTVTTVANTTGVINKAGLTITALTNTKTYDSTTTAAAIPTVAGLLGGDTVTGQVEVYSDKNAGSGKTLSVSAYTVNDGNGGNNYTVTTITNTTGVINKASLTITALTNTKTYDATTTAAATPTVTGLIGGDTATGLKEVYTDKNAGTGKTLSVSAYTVNDGNSGNNYTVTTVTNNTGVINKASLTITALTNTKAYDSTTTAAAIPTVAGLQGGDTVTGLSESYDTRFVGTGKTLSVNTGYTVNDGNSGNNYAVTTVTNTTGVINKASLTITATTNTKTYDGTTTAGATPTVTGLLSGDSVTGLAEVYSDKNAGTGKTLSVSAYTINDGNGGNDYIVTTVANTTGVINKASLTITALTNTKGHDGTTSAAAVPTVSGLVTGDTASGLTEVYSDPNAGSGKTLSVSAYTINDGNGGNNYAVTTVNNTTGVIEALIPLTPNPILEPPQGSQVNLTFTVTLLVALDADVRVNYSTRNLSGPTGALGGEDYGVITNAVVIIPKGQTSATFNVAIYGDAPEPLGGPAHEFFAVDYNWAILDPTLNNQSISPTSVTADIIQTFVPTVSMPAAQPVHISGNTYAVQLNLTSSYPNATYAAAGGTVYVNYYTSNGSATNGVNYQGVSGTLALPSSLFAGPTNTTTIMVTGIGPANGQTFNMNLASISTNGALVAPTTSVVTIYNPQIALGQPTDAPGGTVLTADSDLTPIINAAESKWIAAGANSSNFKDVQFQIGTIGSQVLGNTTGKIITIDASAAGFKWYVNTTNNDFQAVPNSANLLALPGSAAAGHMDLLTVVEHELGHILGLQDMDAGDSLMTTTLMAGERRLPPGTLVSLGTSFVISNNPGNPYPPGTTKVPGGSPIPFGPSNKPAGPPVLSQIFTDPGSVDSITADALNYIFAKLGSAKTKK